MSIKIIGPIYKIENPESETPTSTLLPGFHVNSAKKLAGLSDYEVFPATPDRVIFGVHTYFYTFESELEAKQLLNWDEDTGYNPSFEPPLPPVPASVTRRQALTVLTLGGYIEQIESAIAAIQDPQQRIIAQIFWRESQQFERYNPTLIALAYAIRLTDEQLDDLFRQAATY